MAKAMYEPITTERQCTTCHKCKPLSEFGRNKKWPDGVSRRCTQCDRQAGLKYRAKLRKLRPPRSVTWSPTAWLLPSDPRDIQQQLLAATQRRWRYECEPAANLTWIIGSAA